VPAAVTPEKSIVWTRWPDAASGPRGSVSPEATTAPAASASCHGTGSTASVTTVAPFGASGRYPTWFTRTRGPVSGTYTGGSAPPTSDTLSRQNVHGSALPPIWNANCSTSLSTVDVNTWVKRVGSGPSVVGRDSRSVHGSTCSCTFASTPTGRDADASNDSS
jgi:hypothetical protein